MSHGRYSRRMENVVRTMTTGTAKATAISIIGIAITTTMTTVPAGRRVNC